MSKIKNKELTGNKGSLTDGINAYLKGVKSEWGKITWPEKNQIIYETLVVLGVVIAFTVVVLVLDLVFKYGVFKWLMGIPSR